MEDTKMPHAEHDKHLCYLENMGYVKSSLEDYKGLVRDSKFVCRGCGRTARSDKNLCEADEL